MVGTKIRWVMFCCFIVSMVLALVGVGFDLLFQVNFQPKMKQWQHKKMAMLPRYLEDRDFFINHPYFGAVSPRKKDFADYMASRIVAEKDYVVVPLEAQRKAMALEDDWLERRYRLQLPPSALEIFQGAMDYDYWNVEKSLTIKHDLSANEFVIAGQVLLAHAVDSDEETRNMALKKLRHFASLLLSSENFNFKLASLSLLAKEKQFTQFLSNRMPAKTVEWQHVAESDITRFRDYMYQSYDYMDFLMGSQTIDKIFATEPPPIGFCAIYKLKEPSLSKAAHFISNHFPFEPDYRHEAQSFKKLQHIAESHCHPVGHLTQHHREITSYIPFFRRIVALRFMLNNKSLADL